MRHLNMDMKVLLRFGGGEARARLYDFIGGEALSTCHFKLMLAFMFIMIS